MAVLVAGPQGERCCDLTLQVGQGGLPLHRVRHGEEPGCLPSRAAETNTAHTVRPKLSQCAPGTSEEQRWAGVSSVPAKAVLVTLATPDVSHSAPALLAGGGRPVAHSPHSKHCLTWVFLTCSTPDSHLGSQVTGLMPQHPEILAHVGPQPLAPSACLAEQWLGT